MLPDQKQIFYCFLFTLAACASIFLFYTTFIPPAQAWTDNTINPGSTPVRATHINEIRAQINANRALVGLSAASWTDDPITSSTKVRTIHFQEMRNAIRDAYIGPWANDKPNFGPAVSGSIKADNISSLRAAIETWGYCGDGVCQAAEGCNGVDKCLEDCNNPCPGALVLHNASCGGACPGLGNCGSTERCYSQQCLCNNPEYSCQPDLANCHCTNGIQDFDEAAIDCGGALCSPCCGNGDCQTGIGETIVTCAADCAVYCGNLSCEAVYGEDGSTCPKDCCDASVNNADCVDQNRDGYDWCVSSISSPQDGSSSGYTFIWEPSMLTFCDHTSEAYSSYYDCGGVRRNCCNPMAGTIAGKWSTGDCGCNNNGVQDGDEAGVDCGGTHCAACCNDNGICDPGENCANCFADCNYDLAGPDKVGDCGDSGVLCPDDACGPFENCYEMEYNCSGITRYCNGSWRCHCSNGTCEPGLGEDADNCNFMDDGDCGCGDSICQSAEGENADSCAGDCYCGDSICDIAEDEGTLPCCTADCGVCASCTDGAQNGDETGVDCGGSCPSSC